MKVRHQLIGTTWGGLFYIREEKPHWWSKWQIVRCGMEAQLYRKINGKYIAIN